MKARTEYDNIVKHPGKFENEQSYIPYYWEVYLDGFCDDDDGNILKFNVTQEDKKLFPELKRRKVVRLLEREDGFVIEV